ncbi:MAG TPA: response regulator, partial [Duganella sp.]|uniref:response regulator n=1 Tax=Duganella sp. TaxID=1904440 RepID=UPI002ED62E33
MIDATQLLNANILIVDDQEANVMLLERMLGNAGYTQVTSTMDPFAVSGLHLANHYDLILLDLQMPGMDGFEVLEALKVIEPDGYVPVLVVTAQPGHKLRALQAGAKDFVAKPFELVEVETRIHNMLEVRLLHRQLNRYNQQLEHQVMQRTAELRASEARFQRY